MVFFSTYHALKMWFKLLRVKLYRYDLKGNINYFELAGGLSYRGFAFSIVQTTEAKITLQVYFMPGGGSPGEIDFGSS